MAGVTDAPFRKMMRRFGPELSFSEMISADSLANGHKGTRRMCRLEADEYPVAVQLAGHRPETMGKSAKIVAGETSAVFLNINMGCPVRKIVSAGNGCALMKDADAAARLVEAAANACALPVTVKCRLGWSEDEQNYVDFARKTVEAGARAVFLHGRTQTQGYGGAADWNAVKVLKETLNVPVIGNGDVDGGETAAARLKETGADAVMVGRALLGKPWLLHDCAAFVADKKPPFIPTDDELIDIIFDHLALMENYFGPKNAVFVARKHIAWYASGRKSNAVFREKVNNIAETGLLRVSIRRFFKEGTI